MPLAGLSMLVWFAQAGIWSGITLSHHGVRRFALGAISRSKKLAYMDWIGATWRRHTRPLLFASDILMTSWGLEWLAVNDFVDFWIDCLWTYDWHMRCSRNCGEKGPRLSTWYFLSFLWRSDEIFNETFCRSSFIVVSYLFQTWMPCWCHVTYRVLCEERWTSLEPSSCSVDASWPLNHCVVRAWWTCEHFSERCDVRARHNQRLCRWPETAVLEGGILWAQHIYAIGLATVFYLP